MGKSKKRAARRKKARAGSDSAEEETKEQPTTPSDDEDVEMEDLDSDFENLSNDEGPADRQHRHKPARIDDWAQEIIQKLVEKSGQEIKMELHSEAPDFSKVEKLFKKANQKIQKANGEHNVSMERNLINGKQYRINYDSWYAFINTDMVRDSPEKGWKAYDGLYGALSMFNHGNNLPDDWNIPPDATIRIFGERPKHMKSRATEEEDSAVEYSEESESESEESSDEYGIDALESKMRKEYTALSRGKALYWWRVGTGTQIFVRYGSKKNPIYRVRAGSSEPYDPQTTELVLTNTRGNSKATIEMNGVYQEVWKHSRHEVRDIIGVGWKVEDDDEANINALASIRPERYATYPHTRVLVKWNDGNTTLERRGFIRRIANGNSFNGDRMIYLKAKELENAYWGYDVEAHWDQDSEAGDNRSSDESWRHHHRTSRPGKSTKSRRGARFIESEQEESDADSETSQSSLDQAQTTRRSKRRSAKKSKPSKRDMAIDAKVRFLTEQLNQLKVKQQQSSRGGRFVSKDRHRRNHGQ